MIYLDRQAPVRGHSPWLDWRVVDPSGAERRATTIAELLDALNEEGDPSVSLRGADEVFMGRRIAVVTNIPTHYRVPLWNPVAEKVSAGGGHLRVLFASGGPGVNRSWLQHQKIQFDHRFLRTRHALGQEIPIDLGRELRTFDPTIVLSGGFSPSVTGRVVRFARGHGIPFGLWSGDTYRQATARSHLRRLERKWIVKRTSFAISYGWLSGEYVRSLAPHLPLVIARNTAPFLDQGGRQHAHEDTEVLAVAQAIPRKGLDIVVDAFQHLDGLPCRLTIAGGGPELEKLRARASGSEQIRFLGAVDSNRILDCYRQADVFVFPSRSDVFGLVLVEAMGSGLATITSAAPGAVGDLAVHERNCLVIEGDDPKLWADAIRRLVEDSTLRRALGQNAKGTILQRWTMEHSVDAWIAAFRLGLFQAA